MSLTDLQVKYVRQHVRNNGIMIASLEDDLVDHLCCEVEKRMVHEKDFYRCLNEALNDIAASGLIQIQQRTDLLLHPNKFIMKKATYFIGMASSMSFSMGLMLKLLYMPGGEELINYGFLAFAFVFLPAMLVMRLVRQTYLSGIDKFKIAFGVISAVGLALSIITKIRMELTLSTILFMSTATVFSFGFLPLYFYQMYKREIA